MSARPQPLDEAPLRYLTVAEVAKLARCEHKAVRRAIRDGMLAAFSPNRKLLIRESDAVQWVESRPAPSARRHASTSRAGRQRTRSAAAASVEMLREIERELTGQANRERSTG